MDAVEHGQHQQGAKHRRFARIKVENRLQLILGQHPEHHATVQVESVGRRQDDAGRGEQGDPAVDLERAEHGQELAHEARRAGKPDVGHGEDHESRGIAGHTMNAAPAGGALASMHAVVDHADAKEQGTRHDAVGHHLEDGTLDALLGEGEQPHRHETHVSDGRVGDQFLHVLLHQRDERRVDDRDHR